MIMIFVSNTPVYELHHFRDIEHFLYLIITLNDLFGSPQAIRDKYID